MATKNRADELRKLLLPSLQSQKCPPEQLIIVDQSSDDSTKKVIESFAQSIRGAKPQLLYLYETNHMGAASARNSAIERAEADILVFLDDDVILEPDFLKELLVVYQQHTDAGGVSGVITNYPRPSLRWRVMRRLFWTGLFHDERQPIYWNADHLRDHMPFRVRKFGSGLMSLKRSALGGDRFDARYKGAGAEDIELSWRLSERDPLFMTPRARLAHVRTQTGRSQSYWLQFDALSSYYLYGRHWKAGILNRVCFAWLNIGYCIVATLMSLRDRSWEPWQALLQGIKLGREQVGMV